MAPCSAEKNKRVWCGRCMDPFERCWNICAKPARGRVHPVAVLTASGRMSRNSCAGWPTVHHQRAPPCEGCPMFIHADDRPRRTAARCQCTLDNPHTAAQGGEARLAIRRASFATSDCLQSPQLRGGLDHAPVSRRCSNISQNGPCTEHTRLSCSSRLSAAPQLRARKWYLSSEFV